MTINLKRCGRSYTSSPPPGGVTGVTDIIDSNLLETPLEPGQRVVGLGNFVIRFQRKLDKVRSLDTGIQILLQPIRALRASLCRIRYQNVRIALFRAALRHPRRDTRT